MKTCVISKCIDCGEIKMLSKRKSMFVDGKKCDSCGSGLVILNQCLYGIDLSNSKDMTNINK